LAERYFRPCVELLEDRLTTASITSWSLSSTLMTPGTLVTYNAAWSSTSGGAAHVFQDGVDLGFPGGFGSASNNWTWSNSWTPPQGAHTIELSVTDNSSTDTRTTNIIVSANTTTSVAINPTSLLYGQGITFTASFAGVGGSLTASQALGTLQIFVDGNLVSSQTPSTSGTATFTTSTLNSQPLALGQHTYQAFYTGDGNNWRSSNSSLNVFSVGPQNTTTFVSASANPASVGQNVTFTATVVPNAPGPNTGVPPGFVEFFVDGNSVSFASLNNGTANFSTSTLSIGSHNITAQYFSNSVNFNGSTSAAYSESITGLPTATTVASSATLSVSGQLLAFTATIIPLMIGSTLPTGSVNFFVDGNLVDSNAPVSGDTASFLTSSPTIFSVGNHSVTAQFVPTAGSQYSGSTSPAIVQTVVQADTTTALAATPNPANQGNLVTLTANVAPVLPGAGNPTGTVTFFNGGTNLGTGTVSATVSGGVATLSTSTLPVGADSLTAVYSGDTTFNTSTSAPLTETVGPAALGTSLALQSAVNPSIFGQSVTFTATVSPVSGTVTPTGTVIFTDTTLNPQLTLGTGTVNAAGQATVTVSSLQVNTAGQTIQASYVPTGNFAASSATLTQNINSAATTTALAAAPPAISVGQSVTFTATVSVTAPGAGPATGNVQFFVDNFVTPVATSPLGANGTATFTTSALSAGMHNVSATYVPTANSLGGFNFLTSNSQTISESVGPATPTVVLTPPPNPNPAGLGSPVTISATVTPPSVNGIAPTGFVQFFDNGVPIGGNVTIPASPPGPVTVSTTTSALPQGSDVLTAFYSGDTSYNSGTSAPVTETVQGGVATTTALTATPPSPTTTGQSVTLNATVTHPGTTAPTGTITFQDGGTVLQTVPISAAGTASFTVASPTAGSHTYSANYSGDSLYSPSSASVVQVVQAAQTTITLSTSGTPAMVGRPVTFTVAVAPVSPATGTPTGTVTFFDNGTAIGTATLNNGTASFSTSSLARGNHSITASYSGDPNFLASTTTTALSQFIANVGFIFTR
jgi:hypothetical protein